MPELPEVETIRRDLMHDIKGKRIADVEVLAPKLIKEPSAVEFKSRLKGATFVNFFRRAKVLSLELSTGDYLVAHLRMTGQLVYAKEKDKQARVIFSLANGEYLNFNDQRLFAELRLVRDWLKLKFVQGLGPEPLGKSFTLAKFKQMLSDKKTKIKPLLMDQSFIAGIGNLYAQEILFLSGILPTRAANQITAAEAQLLYKNIQEVLEDAIRLKGSSVDNYVGGRGEQGKYHLKLKVYMRQGKACVQCKTPISKSALGGRGTCFCPKCQK